MTRRLAPPPPGTFLLAAVAAVLLWQLDRSEPEMGLPVVIEPDPARTEAVDPGTTLPEPFARPDAFYDAIVERPLFAENRRPGSASAPAEMAAVPAEIAPTVEADPKSNAPPEPPALILKGVMLQAEERSALLVKPGGTEEWIREGELIGAWKLDRITADHVQITNSGVTLKLDLYTLEKLVPFAPVTDDVMCLQRPEISGQDHGFVAILGVCPPK